VHAPKDALLFEGLEVSPDGHLRDLRPLTELGDGDLAPLLEDLDGDLAARLDVHGGANVRYAL